jgi:hypothetical protein
MTNCPYHDNEELKWVFTFGPVELKHVLKPKKLKSTVITSRFICLICDKFLRDNLT